MVRSENKYLTLGIWVFDFVQRDGKGREGNRQAYPCRMFVGCCRTSWTRAAVGQGSVEDWRAPHGSTASRAASGVAKGGDGISGRKKNMQIQSCKALGRWGS